jgi:mono/diheme cytochrome c family protein
MEGDMRAIFALARVAGLGACGDQAQSLAERASEAREKAAQEDTVQIADEAYDLAHFDTIDWGSEPVLLERGQLVWRVSCQKCHGEKGLGDAGFVLEGDTLKPPSFLEPDWRFATETDSLRRYIFTGNTSGMPHWGLVPLKPYDIGAVAFYIQHGLREGH